MTTGDSGQDADASRVVLQRARLSVSRQVRSTRNLRANVVAAAADTGEARQRRVARVRAARTVKQRRAQDAFVRPAVDIDAIIKMALRADARRSQARQLSVRRSPALPVSRDVLARLPIIKVDVARVAQGRQLSSAKVSVRSAGT